MITAGPIHGLRGVIAEFMSPARSRTFRLGTCMMARSSLPDDATPAHDAVRMCQKASVYTDSNSECPLIALGDISAHEASDQESGKHTLWKKKRSF